MPRRRLHVLLTLTAALVAACQPALPPVGAGAASPSAAPREAATPRPSAAPSAAAKASPSASPTASPRPAGPVELARLAPPVGAIAGQVRVDAGYLVAAGGGNVLSHNGGTLVAAGGLNLIGTDGSTLRNQGGQALVAAGAGNAIAAVGEDGRAALRLAGSALIGTDGSTLTTGGSNGTLIGTDGSTLISESGSTYQLAQAPASAPPSAAAAAARAPRGELPAVGMMVWARSLVTGEPLPLGQDARGQAVWAVYTDAEGRYQLGLPADLRQNVLIVAEAPFRRDGRLGYGRLQAVGEGAVAAGDIDADTTALMRVLRRALAGKFSRLLANAEKMRAGGASDDTILDVFFANSKAEPATIELVRALVSDLIKEVRGNEAITTANFPALALSLGDAMLGAGAGLGGIPVDDAYFGIELQYSLENRNYLAHRDDAFAMLGGVMRATIQGVKALDLPPDELEARFAARPYIQRANAFAARRDPKATAPRWRIRTWADLSDFLVEEYLTMIGGASYGCEGADCPPLPAACSLLGTGGACFPEAGAGNLSVVQLRELVQVVMQDVGQDISDAYVMSAASNALGARFGALAAVYPDLLHCTVRRFGHEELPPCPLAP